MLTERPQLRNCLPRLGWLGHVCKGIVVVINWCNRLSPLWKALFHRQVVLGSISKIVPEAVAQRLRAPNALVPGTRVRVPLALLAIDQRSINTESLSINKSEK